MTAVHSGAVGFLPEALASLDAQVLPNGWAWEWCVQEDGPETNAARHLRDDPRIRIGTSRKGGPGVARTMAFARSRGEYIRNLDADDQFPSGALCRDIEALETHPDIGWTTSSVIDLMEDGSHGKFDLGDPSPGAMSRGSAFEYWKTRYRPQVHPATLCVRRQLLALLGGWMAVPASEDTGLLLSLDAISQGFFTDEVGLIYRKHPGQITRDPAHGQGPEWEARMALIIERVQALRQWTSASLDEATGD
ncbi:glycosyltransferase family 2 protein [Streptomyces buecherae]|uniref:glycosyltransferase family 2 protein n=1 Tax=Streptomyces buecherae TaxID=2763006 RepID=UPI002FCD1F74